MDELAFFLLDLLFLLGHIDEVTDLVLGDERPLREAAAGKDQHGGVGDPDQELAQRSKDGAESMNGPSYKESGPVRPLHGEGLRDDLRQHEDDDRHDDGRDDLSGILEQVDRQTGRQHGSGDVRQQHQQENDVQVVRWVLDDLQQCGRALLPVLCQVMGLGASDARDRGLGHGAERGDHQQEGYDDQCH
jgi:hypothetical protein